MPPQISTSNFTPLADVISQLWETGQVRVLDLSRREISAADREETWLRLSNFAHEEQAGLPGPPPPLERMALEWGATMFSRACSFFIHRDHPAADMLAALSPPCPAAPSPSTCYSVDLTFRFLPDLHRLVQQASPQDPLCQVLKTWGLEWPLSSVGLEFKKSETPEPQISNNDLQNQVTQPDPGSEMTSRLDSWWDNPCLRRLYVDRVLDRGDTHRLADPRVAQAVREVLGYHPELSVKMAAALQKLAKAADRATASRAADFVAVVDAVEAGNSRSM